MRVAWAVVALHLVLLGGYSLLAPTYRAPDELNHVDLARFVGDDWSYPEFDERRTSVAVEASLGVSPAFAPHAGAVGEGDAPHRAARPSFADLGTDESGDTLNQLAQHPPLAYGVYGVALVVADVLPGDLAFDQEVGLLRLVSVALLAPLPLLAWATARRFGASDPVALTAAVLMVAVPSLAHIGSVTNNDVLLILLGAVATWLIARVLTGDEGFGTALALGAVVGAALLTKGFAFPLVPAAAGAYLLAPGARRRIGPVVARAGTVGAVALAVGGWWWVRNQLEYGTLQPGAFKRPRTPPADPGVFDFLPTFLDRLIESFWGSFGYREAAIPLGLSVGATVVVAALAVAALVLGPGWGRRARLAWLLVPAALAAAMVGFGALRAYNKTGVPYATQGRYLFVGLVGIMVVAAIGAGRLARSGQWLPLVTLVGVGGMHAVAVRAMLNRFWAGDSKVDQLRSVVAFAPWPGAVVGVVAAVGVVIAVGAVVVVLAGVRRPAPPSPAAS